MVCLSLTTYLAGRRPTGSTLWCLHVQRVVYIPCRSTKTIASFWIINLSSWRLKGFSTNSILLTGASCPCNSPCWSNIVSEAFLVSEKTIKRTERINNMLWLITENFNAPATLINGSDFWNTSLTAQWWTSKKAFHSAIPFQAHLTAPLVSSEMSYVHLTVGKKNFEPLHRNLNNVATTKPREVTSQSFPCSFYHLHAYQEQARRKKMT